MNLEELLEVEVGDLGLVVDAEELGERGVGDDAALEVGVKAVVALDVVRDVLGHLGLRALGASGDSHEGAELRGERLLLEERVVGATSLPGCLLLGGHGGGIHFALLLRVASLLLGGFCGFLGRLHSLAHTCGELGGERLELLSEGGEESIGGLRNGGCRSGNRGNGDLNLGGNGLLLLGLGSLGGLRSSGRGGRRGGDGGGGFGLLGGLLVGGHLVCLRSRDGGGHF